MRYEMHHALNQFASLMKTSQNDGHGSLLEMRWPVIELGHSLRVVVEYGVAYSRIKMCF